MNHKTALALLCITLTGISDTFAQENREDRRGRRSRFGSEQPAQSASYAPLQLRGMIGSGDNMEVSITNPQTNESQWVRVRDKTAKWYVESANPTARSVVVRLDGMSLKLEMIRTTGEPRSIAPLPTPLSADQAAAEAARGIIRVNGMTPKELVAQMAARRASGERPSPEEMRAFGEQVNALTPEQRNQFFSQMRTEAQSAGVGFGPQHGGGGGRQNAPTATVTTPASNSGSQQTVTSSSSRSGGGNSSGSSGGGRSRGGRR